MSNKHKLFLLQLCIPILVGAQQWNTIETSRNGFRNGDVIVGHSVQLASTEVGGNDAVWNIVDLDAGNVVQSSIDLLNDTVAVVGSKNNNLYIQNEYGLQLIGYEDRTMSISLDDPIQLRKAEMVFGDSLECLFRGKGLYGGKVHLSVFGQSKSVADGYGTVIFNNDTIRDVVRLHYSTVFCIKTSDKPLPDIHTDSIPYSLAHSDTTYSGDRWMWFVPGSRYPIIESSAMNITRKGSVTELRRDAQAFLPESQWLELAYDETNADYMMQLIDGRRSQPNGAGSDGSEIPISVNASLSPDGFSVHVDYVQTNVGEVRFTVSDVLGHLLASITLNGTSGQADISLQRNPVGNYVVLSVCGNGFSFSQKTYKEE